MTEPARPLRRRIALAMAAAASVAAAPATLAVLPAGATDGPASPPAFQRINVDSGISGASFTSVGKVFGSEQNIVTSGYGALDDAGRPAGGSSLQVYRPGATLADWTEVTVFGPSENIVFPNATTIDDVDGDGDNDIIVPSGYFFGTDPAASMPLLSGAITWWENHGSAAPFEKHVVVEGQAGAYHGVQFVDLDKDGIKDLLTVSEEARQASEQTDDTVEVQLFKGTGAGAFAAPVSLGHNVGGSQPVTHDMDADGDLDIVSAQYFHLVNDASAAPFLWLENGDTDGTLTASDFTPRPIASFLSTSEDRGVGMGFQIRPVPGFRGPGTISWVGTNHVNRCTIPGPFSAIPEEVIEFLPNVDLREQWELNSLSDTATPPPVCPTDYKSGDYLEFSDQITARYGYGQGAPGVFGYGDIDGDQDIDLLVSGDGDRRLWWIENTGAGSTKLHRLTGAGEYFGQAGGAVVVDLNGNGTNELVFSSFDQNTLALWTRDSSTPITTPTTTPTPTPTTPPVRTVRSALNVSPDKRTVRSGKRATWTVRLQGAPGGARRTVSVVFDPARGTSVRVARLTLKRTGKADLQRGRFGYRPKKKGRLVVTYRGARVTASLRDTASTDVVRVLIR